METSLKIALIQVVLKTLFFFVFLVFFVFFFFCFFGPRLIQINPWGLNRYQHTSYRKGMLWHPNLTRTQVIGRECCDTQISQEVFFIHIKCEIWAATTVLSVYYMCISYITVPDLNRSLRFSQCIKVGAADWNPVVSSSWAQLQSTAAGARRHLELKSIHLDDWVHLTSRF